MSIANRDKYHSRSVLYDKRLTLQNFKNESTYDCDYCFYLPRKRWVYKWPQDTSEKNRKPSAAFVPISFDTLIKWRAGSKLPFNLLWEPKPIVGTNPHEERVPKHIDTKIDNSEKKMSKEPTTILSPAVRINAHKEYRDIIIKNIYKSDWARASERAAHASFSKRNATSTLPTVDPNTSLTYKPDVFPALPLGWRQKAIDWDYVQERAMVDPTKAHWLKVPLQDTEIMESTRLVSNEVKQEIAQLISENKLRQAHDKICVSFAGYRPRNSRGVSLRKKDLPMEHPYLCVSESIGSRYNNETTG